MSKISIKKALAAIAAAVLGFSALSRAATVPYTTGFEADGTGDSDSPPQSYTPGNLVGQNSWTNYPTEPATGATVYDNTNGTPLDGKQSVLLSTVGSSGGASTASPIYSDFYNSSLTPVILPNGNLTATFKMNTALGASSATGPEAGLEIFNGAGNVIASLFAGNGPDNLPDLTIFNAATNGTQQVSGIGTAGDGNTGTYSIFLDTSNDTFTVTSSTGQTVTATLGSDPGGLISAIAFATIDQGGSAASATFDDLSVTTGVPEPTSFAMIGVGGLMLLARRPKKQLI